MNAPELQLLHVKEDMGPLTIAYYFRPPAEGQPTFVWFCGFKSDMNSLKAGALDSWASTHGAGCLRFDYSGHGKSSGRFEDGTVSSWLNQASALHSSVLSDRPSVFVGSSMGGWIALLLAHQLEAFGAQAPKGIVSIAPAWNMTELMWELATDEARATLIRDGVYMRPSAYGAPYSITKGLIEDGERHLLRQGSICVSSPVRILHGCRDDDIPWRHSLKLLDTLPHDDARLTLIKDGEHRLSRPQDLALLFATLTEFLN